jgi:hypothetical protein
MVTDSVYVVNHHLGRDVLMLPVRQTILYVEYKVVCRTFYLYFNL